MNTIILRCLVLIVLLPVCSFCTGCRASHSHAGRQIASADIMPAAAAIRQANNATLKELEDR